MNLALGACVNFFGGERGDLRKYDEWDSGMGSLSPCGSARNNLSVFFCSITYRSMRSTPPSAVQPSARLDYSSILSRSPAPHGFPPTHREAALSHSPPVQLSGVLPTHIAEPRLPPTRAFGIQKACSSLLPQS